MATGRDSETSCTFKKLDDGEIPGKEECVVYLQSWSVLSFLFLDLYRWNWKVFPKHQLGINHSMLCNTSEERSCRW